MDDAGYSASPLAKKLVIYAPLKLMSRLTPEECVMWIGGSPDGARLVDRAKPPIDAALLFVIQRAELNALPSNFVTNSKPMGLFECHGIKAIEK